MNREETKKRLAERKEQAKVEQHFADGGKVECESVDNSHRWRVTDYPKWFWNEWNYRIKPDPVYEPYARKDIEQLLEKTNGMLWFRKKVAITNATMVTGLTSVTVRLGDWHCNWVGLFDDWEHLDGTPAGKVVKHDK